MNHEEYCTRALLCAEMFSLGVARWFSQDLKYDGLLFSSAEPGIFTNISRFVTGSECGDVCFDAGILFNSGDKNCPWYPFVNVYYHRIRNSDQCAIVAHDGGLLLHKIDFAREMMVDGLGYEPVFAADKIGYTFKEADMGRIYRIKSPEIKFHALMMMIKRMIVDFSDIIIMLGYGNDDKDEMKQLNGAHKCDIETLQLRAEAGNAECQYALALRYLQGQGVEMNVSKYREYLEMAANKGHVCAQHRLGCLYDGGGIGVERDWIKAMRWFKEAANQGMPSAQNCVGDMYNEGQGVDKDNVLAVEWFRRAADQGNPLAIYNLGIAYLEGLGVPKEEQIGIGLLRRSAACGDDESKSVLRSKGRL